MPHKGRALQVTAPGCFQIVDIPVPTPAADEVLIEVQACATCTNWELNTWTGQDIFSRPGYPIYPQNTGSPGHEAAGVVAAVGAEVTTRRPGDHVAIMPSLRGPENDAHASHVTRPASHTALLAPHVDLVHAAPLEMAMCAVRMFEVIGEVTGRRVAIVGLGPAGILHLQVARERGASRIVGLDTLPARRQAAAPFAETVIDAADQEAVAALVNEGVDIAIDCSGHPSGLQSALDMARQAFYVFSVPHGPISWGKTHWLRSVPVLPYHWRGGSQPRSLQRAADLLAQGRLDTRAIITAVLPYARYAEGLRLLQERQAIKVVFSGWE